MTTAVPPIILAIQNDHTDPPHLAGRWLMELGFQIQVLRADQGEFVPATVPDGVAGVMPLGGHMGALDDHIADWLPNERALLADAVAREIPVFAICLGSQLLAEATGGSVSRAEVGEVGVYTIETTSDAGDDPVFTMLGGSKVAQWHEDEVSVLPPNAVRLAYSPLCPNQIYRIGRTTYAVQFHPEIDTSIIRNWEADADNAFLESGKKTVEPEMAAAEAELELIWKPVIQNWGRLILSL
ncbi:MAG: type 1 glutamine amidotransferase [Actinomycetes bacterium]